MEKGKGMMNAPARGRIDYDTCCVAIDQYIMNDLFFYGQLSLLPLRFNL